MTIEEREQLLAIMGGLMMSDNMGDVHDEINRLCKVLDVPEPEGNYLEGWSDADLERVGLTT